MATITAHDLHVRLADVMAGLAVGEEFLLTDHGRPVARIVPAENVPSRMIESEDKWLSRWYTWTDGHPKREIVIDDSRETIYGGHRE
jgi:prevent-host-death family protein